MLAAIVVVAVAGLVETWLKKRDGPNDMGGISHFSPRKMRSPRSTRNMSRHHEVDKSENCTGEEDVFHMFHMMKLFEKGLIKVIMVMMVLVLALATLDLGWLIIKDLIEQPYFLLSIDQLLEIFGLFMLVLIGIELLETVMKTYLTEGHSHYEVVLSVAIIAISRKVIILDMKETDSLSLIGIAGIIVALTLGYFLMKRSQSDNPPHSKNE